MSKLRSTTPTPPKPKVVTSVRTDLRAMPSQIVTERLTLGAWHDEDLPHYAAMTNERDVRAAAAPAGGRVDESIVRARLVQRQRELDETGIALLAVRVAGVFAGYCGLTIGHASFDEPEIAYELLQQFQGRGYATEAAQAIVAAAGQTGRRRLWASVRPWNASSFRVLTKVGFTATDREVIDAWGRTVWWTRVLDVEAPT
jgi:RimJ/RimL family protein N-acetyltransferase